MSKLNEYIVSYQTGSTNRPITRQLSVFFELDDVPSEVIQDADFYILEDAAGGSDTVFDTLVVLNEQETVDLLTQVWTEQMSTMGNAKFAYANRLRDAINAAQNA